MNLNGMLFILLVTRMVVCMLLSYRCTEIMTRKEGERKTETVHKKLGCCTIYIQMVAVIAPSHIHRKANVKASSIRNECLQLKCCTTDKDNHWISMRWHVFVFVRIYEGKSKRLLSREADERLLRENTRSLCWNEEER